MEDLGVVQRGITYQVVIIIVESAVLFCALIVAVVILVACNKSPLMRNVLIRMVKLSLV